jgi:hypothetical protein
MIFPVKNVSFRATCLIAICLVFSVLPLAAQKRKDQLQKPIAGPRATALRVTWLYVSADLNAQKVDRVQIGRELVVAEKSGDWLRVFANTDIELERGADAPIFDTNEVTPPISGWMQAKGVVIETTPNGDQVLMGAAAEQEALANDPRGPVNAARTAHLLYRRIVEMFPNSPLAPEAAWRSADIQWQIEKADAASRPSAKEQAAYLRQQLDEDPLKHVIKDFPRTKQADYAAFELLDNKLCGDWQGSPKCPEKEAEIYQRYADAHPDSPNAARSLYEAVYRLAAAGDLYQADNDAKRAAASRDRAAVVARHLQQKYPQSDDSARSATLIYQMEQSIPIYGAERD